jgi:hypothetical protein
MAPGRNAPCPCGSGKKYKRCCAVKDQTPASSEPRQIDNTASTKRLLLEGEQLEQQTIVNELLSGGTHIDPRKVVGVTAEGAKVVDSDYTKQLARRQANKAKVCQGEDEMKATLLLLAAEQGSIDAVQQLLQEGVPVGGRVCIVQPS